MNRRETADDLLRHVVAEHVGADADVVQVTRSCPSCGSSEHGRPVAVLPGARAPWVSLSRADGLLVAAASDDGPVGVDVERIDVARLEPVSPVLLHPEESAATPAALALTWARKESLLKATGDGLRVDPRLVRLSDPDDAPELLAWLAPRPPAQVAMRDLEIEGYAGSLTVLSEPSPRVTLRWAGPAAPAR